MLKNLPKTARCAFAYESGRRCARPEGHGGEHSLVPDRGSSVLSADVVVDPRRGPGRPPRGAGAADERIELRVTRLERAAWEHAAAEAGITLSEWIRTAAARELRAACIKG